MPCVATTAKAVYPPAVGEPPTRDFLPEDTAALPVYLTLQPIRRAAHHLTMASGGLLPRLFTLAQGGGCVCRQGQTPPPFMWAVILCHVLSAVTRSFPLGSMALCVARTFLTPGRSVAPRPATDRPAALLFMQNYKISRHFHKTSP